MTHTAVPNVPGTESPSATKVRTNNGTIVGIVIGVAITSSVLAVLVGFGVATRLTAPPLGPVESRAFAQSFDGATSASVRLQFGAGQLRVGALESANSNLVTVNFTGPSRYMPEPTYQVRDHVRRAPAGQILAPRQGPQVGPFTGNFQ